MAVRTSKDKIPQRLCLPEPDWRSSRSERYDTNPSRASLQWKQDSGTYGAPEQMFLVQDENGVAYGQNGPDDFFLVAPEYEDEVKAGIHLLPEFIRLYERHQQMVIKGDDTQHYTTKRFGVDIIFF
jgi:hypothetical protein